MKIQLLECFQTAFVISEVESGGTAGNHIVDVGTAVERKLTGQQIVFQPFGVGNVQSGLTAHPCQFRRRDEFMPVVRAFRNEVQHIFGADNQVQIRFRIAVDG